MLLSSHPNDPISSCPVCSYGPKLTKLTALLSVNVQIVSSPRPKNLPERRNEDSQKQNDYLKMYYNSLVGDDS